MQFAVLLFLTSLASAQPQYSISTVAGADPVRDGGSPASAILGSASGLALDAQGNLYIADAAAHRIRKVTLGPGARGPEEPYVSGRIETFAGDGAPSFGGDGGPAGEASLTAPSAIAFDAQGNLYIADSGNRRIRRVLAATGAIETFAGTGATGSTGDGGPASAAGFSLITSLAFDPAGNLVVGDAPGRIRRISADGTIRTIVGGGAAEPGDGGPATAARIQQPQALAFDAAGNLYFTDPGAARVRKVTPDGTLSTVAGDGTRGRGGEGGPAREAPLGAPSGIVAAAGGVLYFSDPGNLRVYQIAADGILEAVVTLPAVWSALALDSKGNLLMARGDAINLLSGEGALGSPIVGDFRQGQDGVPATESLVYNAGGVATDAKGRIYITQPERSRIRVVDADGYIDTWIASPFGLGDGGPAEFAGVNGARGLAVDAQGAVYIADTSNNRVRRVNTGGIIDTIAGNGQAGSTGDGGPGTSAQLRTPTALTVDAQGNVYIAETFRVRKLAANGVISTVAGTGQPGTAGDGGPAVNATLGANLSVAVGRDDAVYIADPAAGRIRRVSPDGRIETIVEGLAGLRTVAVEPGGDLLFSVGHRIQRRSASGTLSTIAGGAKPGYAGDGGPAAEAQLNSPSALWVDAAGSVYFIDSGNHRIRKLAP